MLHDISMLIITKDRQYALPAIVNYHVGKGMPIYIADGTDEVHSKHKVFEAMSDVYYFHCPQKGFFERISLLLEKVNTSYCVVRADRRHQSNHAIAECLKFLKENQGYSSASGFWVNVVDMHLSYANDVIAEPWTLDDPVERVGCHALSFQAPFYNVQTTALWQKRVDIMSDLLEISQHVYFNEYIDYFALFFTGKTRHLNVLGGVIQELGSGQSYGNQFMTTASLLKDAALCEASYAIIEKHLLCDDVEQSVLREAFFRYVGNLLFRFESYGFDSNQEVYKNVKRFASIEKTMAMLRNKEPLDMSYLTNIVQVYMAFATDNMTLLFDVAHLLSQKDVDEWDTLKALAEQVAKLHELEELRLARLEKSS